MKKSNSAASWILAIASTLLTFLFMELVFPKLLFLLPLKTHMYLDDGVRVIAQYSKSNNIPEDYIAIVGDSYAAGSGDWFLSANRNGQPDFHTAHIIHDRTGQDVITFGASGGGSLRGLVGEPIAHFEFINALSHFELEAPETILVYFYEGNDLNNNLKDISKRYNKNYDPDKILDAEYFSGFIETVVHRGDPLYEKAENPDLGDKLIFTKFMARIIKGLADSDDSITIINHEIPVSTFADTNQVFINGEITSIPKELQSPALELTEDELSLSVYVFEQALIYLKNYFPNSKIGAVYIPSPLSSYQIASYKVDIQTYEGRDTTYPSEIVRVRSDQISALIEQAATENGISFIDSRKYILSPSPENIIHGPSDWKHFNKTGYTALSEASLELISAMNKNIAN